jgi:hypothetical protein
MSVSGADLATLAAELHERLPEGTSERVPFAPSTLSPWSRPWLDATDRGSS